MPGCTPFGQRSSVVGRRVERAHDAVADREVVLDDVELRDRGRALGLREDHAVGAGHPQLAPAGVDHGGVGLGHANIVRHVRREQFTKADGATLGYTLLGSDTAPRTLICHPGGPGMPGAYFGDMCGLGLRRPAGRAARPSGLGSLGIRPPMGVTSSPTIAADLERLREQLGLERLRLPRPLPWRLRRDDLRARASRSPQPPCPGLHGGAFQRRDRGPRPRPRSRRTATSAGSTDATDAQRRRQAREYGVSAPSWQALYTARDAAVVPAMTPPAQAFLFDFARQRPDPEALAYFNSRIAPDLGHPPAARRDPRADADPQRRGADFFGPQTSARELGAIPGSRTMMIPGAGHFAFADAPDRFRSELWSSCGSDLLGRRPGALGSLG